MARQKGLRTGRCRGCNHPERVRIERLLAAGASIKGTARKFNIDYHSLRRHWINHVSAEVRASYVAGAGASKDQLEALVADESIALVDHYRIVRSMLYKRIGAASEVGDSNALVLLAGRLHENFRDCARLTGELQRGPLLNIVDRAAGQATCRSDCYRLTYFLTDLQATMEDDERAQWESTLLRGNFVFRPPDTTLRSNLTAGRYIQLLQSPDIYANLGCEMVREGVIDFAPRYNLHDPRISELVLTIANEIDGGLLDSILA